MLPWSNFEMSACGNLYYAQSLKKRRKEINDLRVIIYTSQLVIVQTVSQILFAYWSIGCWNRVKQLLTYTNTSIISTMQVVKRLWPHSVNIRIDKGHYLALRHEGIDVVTLTPTSEGLPGRVFVHLFPSKIALCSPVPTRFPYLFPVINLLTIFSCSNL